MKKQIMLTVLALSLSVAHAQPPEAAKPVQPTAEEQAQWQKQWEEQQREALRHPGTMLGAFVQAMSFSDFKMAAECVVGAENDDSLERWRRIARENQGDWYLSVTPLFQDAEAEKLGDAFTARLATRLSLRNSTPDGDTRKLILSRLETVDLQRDGEKWKIVPRPEIRSEKSVEIEGYDNETIRARQIVSAEADLKTARNENDGIINQWARLMTKSPAQMKQRLGQVSASNIQQLLLGALQFTQDYDEVFAFDAITWREMLMPYVQNKNLFQMPVAEDEKNSTYSFNPALFGKSLAQIAQPARTVAIYEAGDGTGGLNYQHGGQAVVGFVDGHVEFIKPEDLTKLVWNIKPTPSG